MIKFVNLAKKAEEKNNIKFLIEGNALKRKSDEKSDQLEILKKRKEELVSEIKELLNKISLILLEINI